MIPLATQEVAPLLSAVSVMLAAFGLFYTAQRTEIEEAIADTDMPGPKSEIRRKLAAVKRLRNTAGLLALGALLIWALLANEIVERLVAATSFEFDEYSAPDAIFVVAASSWLLLAIYIGRRGRGLQQRTSQLRRELAKREAQDKPVPS